jgi:hypothetical protein
MRDRSYHTEVCRVQPFLPGASVSVVALGWLGRTARDFSSLDAAHDSVVVRSRRVSDSFERKKLETANWHSPPGLRGIRG